MIKIGKKETMTVSELREALNRYPQDMPVFASWEGVQAAFKDEHFSIERNDGINHLVIDVENYWS